MAIIIVGTESCGHVRSHKLTLLETRMEKCSSDIVPLQIANVTLSKELLQVGTRCILTLNTHQI